MAMRKTFPSHLKVLLARATSSEEPKKLHNLYHNFAVSNEVVEIF